MNNQKIAQESTAASRKVKVTGVFIKGMDYERKPTFNQYTILRILGQGGMGRIYEA